MTIEVIRFRLTALVDEVDRDNAGRYYGLVESLVREWRDLGERGGPVYKHLMTLWELHKDDDLKQDVVELVMERMVGWCAPPFAIEFDDWHEESRTWIEERDPESVQP